MDEPVVEDVEIPEIEKAPAKVSRSSNEPVHHVEKTKFVRLPITRIKHIMKLDPDCGLISQDAVFLITKATELFIEQLAREAAKHTGTTKRKTLMRKDVDTAIDSIPQLCFLEGALE